MNKILSFWGILLNASLLVMLAPGCQKSAETAQQTRAQSPELRLDSLRQVWQDLSKPDTSRLEAVNALIQDGYLFSAPDSAQYYAALQLEFATAKGLKAHISKALGVQGSGLLRSGRFQEAADKFTLALAIEKEIGSMKGEAFMTQNLGTAYMYVGDYERCLELLTTAKELHLKRSDSLSYAKCLTNMGMTYSAIGNINAAAIVHQESVEVFESLGDSTLLAYAMGNMAMVLVEQGRYDKALEYLNLSLKVKQAKNDLYGMATAHINIAAVQRESGDFAAAIKSYEIAREFSKQADDQEGISIVLTNLAQINKTLRHYDQTLALLNEAIPLQIEMGDQKLLTSSYLTMGNTYQDMGEANKAIGYFYKSDSVASAIGNSRGMADAKSAMGSIHSGKGDYEKGQILFKEAESIMLAGGDSAGLATIWRNMAKCLMMEGNARSAMDMAEKAWIISKRLGRVEEQRNAAEVLWQASEKLGKYSAALSSYKDYVALRDSLQRLENQQEVIRQRIQADYEKKEVILKAEQEAKDAIADAQLRSHRLAIIGMAGGGFLLFGIGLSGFLLFRQRKRNEILAQSIAARDAERSRLSRELHDGVAGELFGLQMAAQSNKPIDMRSELGRLRDEIRHISHDLAMPDIQKTSLPEMADYLIGRHRHTGREVVLMVQPPDDAQWKLPADKALHIYRMLQEGLGNALRHTATEDLIKVRLNRTATEVNISIENPNGRAEEPSNGNGNGIGLKNLRERAELIGATLRFGEDNNSIVLHIIVPLTD